MSFRIPELERLGLAMHRFIEGEDRMQPALLPHCLEDYVDEENPVRVIEVFIEELDLAALGFSGMTPAATGRPAYHPSALLKIYLYGYLNRIQSSRRLEREAQRNVELMWLTGRLAPDFKTIADFRKDNGVAIRAVCAQFVLLCRHMGLFSDAVVAIDGSKFKAVNNRDQNFTPAKMQRRLAEIEAAIARYMAELDGADAEPGSEERVEHLEQKLASLHAYMAELKIVDEQLRASADGQVSLTDPDARSMNTRGSGMVGYNVQAAVEAKHHLVVAHDVVMTGSDRAQLSPMASAAREAPGAGSVEVVADGGYYSGQEVLACERAGIATHVPKTITSNAVADGRFGKGDFVYVPSSDSYRCPGGEVLTRRCTAVENGMRIGIYWASGCGTC